MGLKKGTYEIPARGLATGFAEAETPIEYARKLRNRYINRIGGAEKRPGMSQLGNTVPGNPDLTEAHELVAKDGSTTLFVSDATKIFKYDGTDYAVVHTMPSAADAIHSVQMGDKLIFFNGVDRNVFTEDGSLFRELKSLIRSGTTGSETTTTRFQDGEITDWTSETDAAEGDIVYFPEVSGYGLVTIVSASALNYTAVGSATVATGLGQGARNPNNGDNYELIDTVELDIVPVSGTSISTNTATLGSGSSTVSVSVSGLDFTGTEIKKGDFIRNTTNSTLAQVVTVSASSLTVTSAASQIAGDSVTFYKQAMPISDWMHVHYQHLYHIDARDKRKVRISAQNDPTDYTSTAGTLDAVTFFAGTLQPQGDVLLNINSYQRFLVLAGEHNIYIYSGTTPTGAAANLVPQALFPQGIVSRHSVQNIGNDMLFVTHDGVQSLRQIADESQLNREAISAPINDTLRDEIDAVKNTENEVRLFHYRQRSWVMCKVGAKIYAFNYQIELEKRGRVDPIEQAHWMSISEFDGLLAQQNGYFERRNDELVCVNGGGKVYLFDQGTFDDDGTQYTTEFQTPWLMMTEPKKSVHRKALKYIKPLFETVPDVSYTVRADGGFDSQATDTVTIEASAGGGIVGTASIPFVIGGSPVSNVKYPLRVNGEVIRLTFTTNDSLGPDTISRYTLYASEHGVR